MDEFQNKKNSCGYRVAVTVREISVLNIGMSIPSELKVSSRRFMEQLLMCRPRDSISFAMQYFYDEKCPTPAVNHAIHSLPFLIRNPVEFRSAVATIYCAETAVKESSDDGKNKSSGANAGGASMNGGQADKEEKAESGSVKVNPGSESKFGVEETSGAGGVASSKDGIKPNVKQNSVIEPVYRDENHISGYLARLCKMARMAIAASDGSLSIACSNDVETKTFSSSTSMKVPGAEATEWIYNLIEKFMLADSISRAVNLNFETYISFLRLYLSLWSCLDWLLKCGGILVESAESTQTNSQIVLELQTSSLKVLEPVIVPDDVDILTRVIKGTYYACTHEEKLNLQVIVTRAFETFAKSVLVVPVDN